MYANRINEKGKGDEIWFKFFNGDTDNNQEDLGELLVSETNDYNFHHQTKRFTVETEGVYTIQLHGHNERRTSHLSYGMIVTDIKLVTENDQEDIFF